MLADTVRPPSTINNTQLPVMDLLDATEEKQPELINERLNIWRNSEDYMKREVAMNFHI